MKTPRKLLVIDVAAFGWNLVERLGAKSPVAFRKAETVFPAVTCTVQASFRTGLPPSGHGMAGNGLWFPALGRVMFWEQSASLVAGARTWKPGTRVGMLFWQQSLGESADVIVSPKPVHRHHGGMIQDCYSRPHDVYADLCRRIGRPFNLMHYWGPLASVRVNDWIVAATCELMRSRELAPDLLFTYLPGLDYELQRRGPDHPRSFQPACPHPLGGGAGRCLEKTLSDLSNLWKTAAETGYDWLVFGDYAIEAVTGGAVFPNRALREAGLFEVRKVGGRAYPDFFASKAFAVADHQVAHVFVHDPADLPRVRAILERLPGVGSVRGRDHARAGDLVLVAEKGWWFAYPWWTDRKEAPDFASHVDIHSKPGYDPCELFLGWPPGTVSQDTSRVRGSHGRVGPGCEVAWASSFDLQPEGGGVLDLARAVGRMFS